MQVRTLIAALALAGGMGMPGAVLVATPAAAVSCDDADAPAGWKRPGGFCEQSSTNGNSLATPGGPGDPPAAPVVPCYNPTSFDLPADFFLKKGKMMIVAVMPPCGQ